MKIIEIITDSSYQETIEGIAEHYSAVDFWASAANADGRQLMRMVVEPDSRQAILDAVQEVLSANDHMRINVLPLEVTLPRPEKNDGDNEENAEDKEEQERSRISTTREELYDQIEKNATLDGTHLPMVFLSTIVAAIGMIENNVAVVVGAMVIAPLLGPNIALAFATSLGDRELIWSALKTNLSGLTFAFALSLAIGWIWQVQPQSAEILSRTDVGPAGVVLALASGAAAVLSLTAGVSSALVGVMVAVALLPPTATLGMMIGAGHTEFAFGAALLLAVNVVCVNLSGMLVFLFRGVKPRTWLEIRKARQSMVVYGAVWAVLLVVLLGAILLRSQVLN